MLCHHFQRNTLLMIYVSTRTAIVFGVQTIVKCHESTVDSSCPNNLLSLFNTNFITFF